MDRATSKAVQDPLKEAHRAEPSAGVITLRATGELGEGRTCKVDTGRAFAEAGLRPLSGGDGTMLCSCDMLLEALVACAGVTLGAVATSLEIDVRSRTLTAEAEFDADDAQVATMLRLTERYCVVAQTLIAGLPVEFARA